MLINPYVFGGYDANAQAYITAVETADGQALEIGVKNAINAFVVGCKADGIWTAIKASCILAGARTLAGALVPLVGAAPTNNNFVSADYNRKTGLTGNGSSKYLNTNLANSSQAQNSIHLATYAYANPSTSLQRMLAGGASTTWLARDVSNFYFRANSTTSASIANPSATGFIGVNRASSSTLSYRIEGISYSASNTSTTPEGDNINIFRKPDGTQYTNAVLSFYSFGESLNLALLDSRVTTLINALAAAIP